MPTASGITFHAPRDLKLARLLADVRAAAGGDAAGRELTLAPVDGTALLELSVTGGPGAPRLLPTAAGWAREWRSLVFAWEYDQTAMTQALVLYQGGAEVATHTLEDWQRPTDPDDLPLPFLEELLGGLSGGSGTGEEGAELTVPLDAPSDEVARREADLAALLARLPDTRALDEQRVVDLVQGGVKRARERPGAATAEKAEVKAAPNLELYKKADRTVITFLIVAVVIIGSLIGLFVALAARAPE